MGSLRESVERQVDQLNEQIVQLYRRGLYQQAVAFASQACDLASRHLGDTHPASARSLNNLATLYESMGNYEAAERLYRQVLEINRRATGEQHPSFARSLNNLAALYESMGNYAAAEPLYRQALEICRRTQGQAHPNFATGLNNLASLYCSMGKYAAAEPLFRQALESRRQVLGEEDPSFATSLNNLAELYRLTGNYAAAEPLYRQAVEIKGRLLGEEHPEFAASLNNLVLLYQSIGDYAHAEPLCRRALEIDRRALGPHHPYYANDLNILAGLYRSAGNYAAAEPLYRQALEISRRALGEEHPNFAATLNNLAALYSSMGNYEAAERLYRQALEAHRRALGEQHPSFAASLTNLADLYFKIGNYGAAEQLDRQALEIHRRAMGEQHPSFATSLNNVASLYRLTGNYASAEPLYRQALEIQHRALGEEHPEFALGLNNLAGMYSDMGNYVAAEPLCHQALAIRRRVLGKEHPDVAMSLNTLAALYVATQREDQALAPTEEAAAIDDRMLAQVFSIGSESQRMAYVRTIQGHFDGFLSLVFSELSKSAGPVRAALDLVLRRKAIGAEALAAQRDAVLGGKYPALEPRLRELTVLRMQIAQETLTGPGEEDAEAYRKRLAEWNARKERVEAELVRQIPEMSLEQRLRTAERHAVALALPEGAALVEFVRFNVFDFKAVPGRGESRWKPSRYLAFILTAGEPDDVHMIDLGEAEAIDRMIATFRAGITGEKEGRGSHDVQAQPTPAPKVSHVLELRSVVFDPLLAALGSRKRLLIAPDGDLSRLPFEVLPTRDGGRLIDDYHISYLTAGRDVLRFRAAKSARLSDSLVVADPDLDLGGNAVTAGASGKVEGAPSAAKSEAGSWSRLIAREGVTPASPAFPTAQPARTAAPAGRQSRDLDPRALHFEPLPGTRAEGEHVAEMLGVRPWLGEDALEAPLKGCHSPRILHLATHGFFLPDQKRDPNKERHGPGTLGEAPGSIPSRMAGLGLENPLLRSGLALAGANTWCRGGLLPPEAEDGMLTAEDVSGLNLLDTELVVLSACETGLGEVRTGEGVFGLRRAFVLAGTKGLVMSLWKVPDEETRKLMEDFYRRILKQQPGQSRAEALRAAQLAMKEKEEYRDPLYWGAFIYEGDPGFA